METTMTTKERTELIMKFRKAKKDAIIANNELYSLGDMNLYDIKAALSAMSNTDFIKKADEVKNFNKVVMEKLNNISLTKDFDLNEYRKKYNQIGCVMSWASSAFDYSNPVLDYIGEEA